MREKSLLGYFFIISGIVLFIFGAWDLIFRVAMAILGVYLINYGLTLNGKPSLFFTISRIINIILWRR